MVVGHKKNKIGTKSEPLSAAARQHMTPTTTMRTNTLELGDLAWLWVKKSHPHRRLSSGCRNRSSSSSQYYCNSSSSSSSSGTTVAAAAAAAAAAATTATAAVAATTAGSVFLGLTRRLEVPSGPPHPSPRVLVFDRSEIEDAPTWRSELYWAAFVCPHAQRPNSLARIGFSSWSSCLPAFLPALLLR